LAFFTYSARADDLDANGTMATGVQFDPEGKTTTMSTTAAQMAANYTNAQHSTGPVTAEGKARSSANALTHGLTSAKVLMPGESQEEYDRFSAAIFADYKPANEHETMLATLVVETTWRYKRLLRMEEAAILSSARLAAEDDTTESVATALAEMFVRPGGDSHRSLSLLLRYLGDGQRAMFKAKAELERIQNLRRQAELEADVVRAYHRNAAQSSLEPAPAVAAPNQHLTRQQRRALSFS
jgi:hypothetical protein